MEETESDLWAQEQRWPWHPESVEGNSKSFKLDLPCHGLNSRGARKVWIHLIWIQCDAQTSCLTNFTSESLFLAQHNRWTGIGCNPHLLIILSTVSILDVQIPELVSCLMLPHSSQVCLVWNMSDTLTCIPLPTFYSVVYIIWSGVTLGFGRGSMSADREDGENGCA